MELNFIHLAENLLNKVFVPQLNDDLIMMSKMTIYIIFTRPLSKQWLHTLKQFLFENYSTNKKRRHTMKRFHYIFASIISLVLLVTITSCYTTFQSVRRGNIEPEYYEEPYYDSEYSDYENDFEDTEPTVEGTTLEYKPTRLVVEKTYFDYGGYVRRVKYVVYDEYEEEWDEYYYPEKVIIYYYFGYPYYRTWFHFGYNPIFYVGWHPIYTWYDPWYCPPIYYPVYHPWPVYCPYPVYYYNPPYHGDSYVSYPNYKKREWDRRQTITPVKETGKKRNITRRGEVDEDTSGPNFKTRIARQIKENTKTENDRITSIDKSPRQTITRRSDEETTDRIIPITTRRTRTDNQTDTKYTTIRKYTKTTNDPTVIKNNQRTTTVRENNQVKSSTSNNTKTTRIISRSKTNTGSKSTTSIRNSNSNSNTRSQKSYNTSRTSSSSQNRSSSRSYSPSPSRSSSTSSSSSRSYSAPKSSSSKSSSSSSSGSSSSRSRGKR
jgi:hypothetical protein